MIYSYRCECGVTIKCASDNELTSALIKHTLGSQIHLSWEGESQKCN